MCEFHDSSGNGFGDIWWTDIPIYFSSIDLNVECILTVLSHSWRIQVSCGTMPHKSAVVLCHRFFSFFSPVALFNVSIATKSQLCIMKTFFLINFLIFKLCVF